jgi:RNA polymerase sigma factor (TIGR02999 family)
MTDVTQILGRIEEGDPCAAEKLLPLVYQELRKLAASRMADERSDHTLQPTALVHEAYLRLVDVEKAQRWNSRAHFFGAAAEAMRRILIESARRKNAAARGGGRQKETIQEDMISVDENKFNLLQIDEAISQLEQHDPQSSELIKLRFFAGLEHQEAADVMGISRRQADRLWILARAWLMRTLREETFEESS